MIYMLIRNAITGNAIIPVNKRTNIKYRVCIVNIQMCKNLNAVKEYND